jgi:vacuolar-type H+-ATPase subunit F/Vma7
MMPIEHSNIAIIGNEDLVNMLRLAGVKRNYVIEDNNSAEEDVRKALGELIDELDVSIVAIQEDYVKYVEDLIAQVAKGSRLTPVIIEVPSKYGTKYPDVAEYYKAFVRKYVGFDIEI